MYFVSSLTLITAIALYATLLPTAGAWGVEFFDYGKRCPPSSFDDNYIYGSFSPSGKPSGCQIVGNDGNNCWFSGGFGRGGSCGNSSQQPARFVIGGNTTCTLFRDKNCSLPFRHYPVLPPHVSSKCHVLRANVTAFTCSDA